MFPMPGVLKKFEGPEGLSLATPFPIPPATLSNGVLLLHYPQPCARGIGGRLVMRRLQRGIDYMNN